MKFLLTGATGFVGAQVARQLLQKGHTVRAHFLPGDDLRRISGIQEELELAGGNLFDSTANEMKELCAGIEACIHTAWYAVPGEYLEAAENLDCVHGSLRLFTELGEAGCKRCVGIGTCFEYDTSYGYLAEDTPAKARTLYAAAKTSTYQLGEQLTKNNDMAFAWARLFYLYGPYEDPRRLIPYVIDSLLQGKTADVSSGVQIRDYLHLEDVASALVAVAQSDLTGSVNIASGYPVEVREIVSQLGEIIGRPELLNIGARPTNPEDPPFICADNSKLKAHTDWVQRYDLKTGLAQTIEWWKEYLPKQ